MTIVADSRAVERIIVDSGRRSSRGMQLAALVLCAVAIGLPHRQLAALVAASGGAADAETGFLLLRLLLATGGLVLAAIAWTDFGARSTPLFAYMRAPAPSTAGKLALAALLLLALALRLPQLGTGPWHDEIATLINNVRPPIVAALTSFESQNNHPLYSLLAKASMALMGDSVFALRLPAVAFGVASVWATWWFGREIGRSAEGLIAAAVLSVSYHHVWFSQNARAYTALLFFALIGTGLFVRLTHTSTTHARRTAAAYAAVMALATYAHLTAALVVIGHCLVWIIGAVSTRQLRSGWNSAPALAFIGAGLGASILYAPGIPHIMADLGGSGPAVALAWKNPLWMIAETVRGLAAGVPGGPFGLLLGGVIVVAGLASYIRDPLLLGLMTVPAALTAALLLATGHNLWPRFFFFAAGFAVLITIRGIAVVARAQRVVSARAVLGAAAVLIVAGAAPMVPRAWGAKQDFAGAYAWVESRRQPGDVAAAAGLAGFGLTRYVGADWPLVESAQALAQTRSTAGQTWVVYAMPELIAARTPDLWTVLQQEFEPVARFPGTLAGGALIVLVSR